MLEINTEATYQIDSNDDSEVAQKVGEAILNIDYTIANLFNMDMFYKINNLCNMFNYTLKALLVAISENREIEKFEKQLKEINKQSLNAIENFKEYAKKEKNN